MLRSVFHLTLRATEGFLRSLFHLLEWELPVPDYTTLCQRAKRLGVSLGRKAAGPMQLVLDSTGLKVFGEGEWKVRQHGYTKRRTWRKLHLSVASETQEIQAVVLSVSCLDDAGAVPELLDQSTESVEQMSGDGAYDKRKVYEGCAPRGIQRVATPPRKDTRRDATDRPNLGWRKPWASLVVASYPDRARTVAWANCARIMQGRADKEGPTRKGRRSHRRYPWKDNRDL